MSEHTLSQRTSSSREDRAEEGREGSPRYCRVDDEHPPRACSSRRRLDRVETGGSDRSTNCREQSHGGRGLGREGAGRWPKSMRSGWGDAGGDGHTTRERLTTITELYS